MEKETINCLIGITGFVCGLIGIGYAFGSRKKLNDICDKLGTTIDEMEKTVTVDIPEMIVEEAMSNAVSMRTNPDIMFRK